MDSVNFDLASASVTDVNGFLHREAAKAGTRRVLISNPDGAHNIAVGLDLPIEIEIDGHAGYYAAGMNKEAKVTISGSARPVARSGSGPIANLRTAQGKPFRCGIPCSISR